MKDTVLARRSATNLFFTLIGLALLIFTLTRLTMDYMLEKQAVEVKALIKAVEAAPVGYKAHVVYQVEGIDYDQYHVDLGIRNKLTVGDYTKIKYDLKDPKKLIHNEHEILLATTGTLAFVILVAFLPGRIKMIKKESLKKRLKSEGIAIQANVQDIIVNTNGKKNKGFYPFRLRANYLNPKDNKKYIYESDDSYINPNDIIAKYHIKTVNVYLDKENTQNYYLDIFSLIPNYEVVDPRQFMKEYYEKRKEAEQPAPVAEPTEEKKEEKK